LHHHLVRCCHCQGQKQTAACHSFCGEGDWLQFAISPGYVCIQDPEACREDYGRPLPPWTQTPCATPLRQKAAVHQDQNLTPPEQLLPVCGWPHQQGPGPPPPNTDSNPDFLFAHSCCNFICVLFIVYCVCLLFAPTYHKKFLVGENLLGSKNLSDSDSDSDFNTISQPFGAKTYKFATLNNFIMFKMISVQTL